MMSAEECTQKIKETCFKVYPLPTGVSAFLETECAEIIRARDAEHAQNFGQRCYVTGNPCGTDTRPVGSPCECTSCRFWEEHARERERLLGSAEECTQKIKETCFKVYPLSSGVSAFLETECTEIIRARDAEHAQERERLEREVLNVVKSHEITENTSDGYHTFKELYEHRHVLFAAVIALHGGWKSLLHDNGTMFDGWFIAGIDTKRGPATYHLPLSWWNAFPGEILEHAPKWDGHTSQEAAERIASLSVVTTTAAEREQAAVAAALREAAKLADTPEIVDSDIISDMIRRSINPAQQAALDRLLADAKREGAKEMRERAAIAADEYLVRTPNWNSYHQDAQLEIARVIRALPLDAPSEQQ